jgi:hypothetical protein
VLQQSPAVVTAQERIRGQRRRARGPCAVPADAEHQRQLQLEQREASFGDINGQLVAAAGPVVPGLQPLPAGGVHRARERAGVEFARLQLDDVRRLARANLERVLGTLETAQQQIELAGQALEVAEEDLRMQQERYRLGVSTILDQVTSQENVVRAEADLIAARYDYQLARAELESLIGRDL